MVIYMITDYSFLKSEKTYNLELTIYSKWLEQKKWGNQKK